jgi:hypothetical protein
MLLSHRQIHMGDVGAWLDTHAVVHTRYRVHLVRRRNVVSEDALFLRGFNRMGHLARPTLTVLLEGRARIRAFDREYWLHPGDVSLIGAKAGVEMRQEAEPAFTSLAIEWDLGMLSTSEQYGFAVGRVAAGDVGALQESSLGIANREARIADAAATTARLLSILRAAGVPFEVLTPQDLVEDVPQRVRHLSEALDGVLSHLEDKPMSVDLEGVLGVGPRQVNRIVGEYNQRYGFNAAGWRDTRKRRQVLAGATLMTAEGAVAERVAATVGYGSARAFCHALATAQLPSPTAIRHAVQNLG